VLACLYGLPLTVSLLAFRLPLVSHFTRQGFWKNLGSSTLVEFLSINVGMIVFLPISNTAYIRFPLPTPASLNSISGWIFYLSPMLIAMVAGLIFLSPLHAWMVRYGVSPWLIPVRTPKMPWWGILVASGVSLIVLFAAFQITLSLTTAT
jgi:sterol desaturase/sphingolipid hydroxylase (fatty acid hydroxylase superfamily)